jgi:hypothetical protein
MVGQDGKLVAYKHITSRFVQYFGKVVPVMKDTSALYDHYEHGGWIVATSRYREGLHSDGRFKQVYTRKRGKGTEEDTGGALFHKSE